MRIGCCGSMIEGNGTGVGIIETLADSGYDYIELSLSHVTLLDEKTLDALLERIEVAGLPCEACNNFFPPSVRITGSNVKPEKTLAYARKALYRASLLGARIVAFGSAGAKNVPAGFSKERACEQITALLRNLDPIAAEYGLIIVVEPLNKLESNIINTVAEGLALVKEVNLPGIQLLVDYYHLMMEKEDVGIVERAAEALQHVHFAKTEGRVFPETMESSYRVFFDHLRRIGYRGRLSVEAYSSNFVNDAPLTLKLLKWLVNS